MMRIINWKVAFTVGFECCSFFFVVTDADLAPPTLESQIKLKYPEHVRFLYLDEEEEDEEIPEFDEDSDMEEDQEEDAVQVMYFLCIFKKI